MLIDPAKEGQGRFSLARLRRKLGVNKFSDETPSGQPNEDYLEPFSGLVGVKQTLSLYLMKYVART